MVDRVIAVGDDKVLPAAVLVPTARLSDSTPTGRALITAADAAAQRTALGLGTAATTPATDYATAAQGATADTAVQPGDLAPVATTGAYTDLTGRPAIPDTPDDIGAATAAQGAKADSASQPGHTHAAGDVTTGTLSTARLGTGTADATTFLRGDQTWATPAAGGVPVGLLPPVGWFGTGLLGGASVVTSGSWAADTVIAHLIYIPATQNVDALGCYVLGGTTGATLRLAVVSNSAGTPGDVLITHAGTLAADSLGSRDVGTTGTLPAGMYWAVAQTGGAGGVTTRSSSIDAFFPLGRFGNGLATATVCLSAPRADAALTGSLAALTWSAATGTPHGIRMRRSA